MDKNKMIKIIGVPGSGKSFLLERLKETLIQGFNFIEFGKEVQKRADGNVYLGGKEKANNAKSLIRDIISSDVPTILTYHIIRRDGEKYEKDLQLEEAMNSIGYVYISAKPDQILKRRIADNMNRTKYREIGDIHQIEEHDVLIRKTIMALQKNLGTMCLMIKNNDDNIQENIEKMKKFIYEAFLM